VAVSDGAGFIYYEAVWIVPMKACQIGVSQLFGGGFRRRRLANDLATKLNIVTKYLAQIQNIGFHPNACSRLESTPKNWLGNAWLQSSYISISSSAVLMPVLFFTSPARYSSLLQRRTSSRPSFSCYGRAALRCACLGYFISCVVYWCIVFRRVVSPK
jgi:hypothetical protein